jgi:hypothetical protein
VKKLAWQASEKLKEHAHNLDLSSLKPLPEKREVGSGVKKPEDQGVQGRGKPREQEEPEELDFDIEFKPLPPATYVGPLSRRRPQRPNRDNPK